MRLVVLKLGRVLLCEALALTALTNVTNASQRPFTVTDDVEMSRVTEGPVWSPDGKHFYVTIERGLLDENVPEYTAWVWSTEEVTQFARDPQVRMPPAPIPLVRLGHYRDGPMNGFRVVWLDDSSGLSYVGLTAKGTFQLFKATLNTPQTPALTPERQNVPGFLCLQ